MKVTNEITNASKILKEIAFEMSVLLVEDDRVIQEQLKMFLSRFFGHVDTANNGLAGLRLYESATYDLVITDLSMPFMDGIELSKKIKEINELQRIMVVSAHSESDKLIKLINIGVDGFLLKPVDVLLTIKQLSKICQALYDSKMLEHFNKILEDTNSELKESNREYQKTLSELTEMKKMMQESNSESLEQPKKETMSALEFNEVYPFVLDQTNENLEELEDMFNYLLVNTRHNINHKTLVSITTILREFVRELELIPEFGAIANSLQQLEFTLKKLENVSKMQIVMPMLTSIFDSLENWRKCVFIFKNTPDVHFLDTKILNEVVKLEALLNE